MASSTVQRPKVSYGLSQPYFNASPMPITVNVDPKTTNYAEIGTIWINKSTNRSWVLTSVVANAAVWVRMDNSSNNAGITWSTQAGVGPIALASNCGYYLTNAGAVTLSLPVAATLGSQFWIATADASAAGAGFTINQNANQYFLYNDATSTVGAGGSLNAINLGNESIALLVVCTVANIEFTVFSANIAINLV